MMKVFKIFSVPILMCLLLAGNVNALSLSYDDTSDSVVAVVIADGGSGDAYGSGIVDGVVAAGQGSTAGDWTIRSLTGENLLTSGMGTSFELDLNSLVVESNAAGTLQLVLTEVAPSSIPGWLAGIGGTTDGVLTYSIFEGNSEFDQANLLGSMSFGNDTNNYVFSGKFGMASLGLTHVSMVVDITHSAAGSTQTSFDATLDPVPEPTTFILFGLGLLGVARVSRRREN